MRSYLILFAVVVVACNSGDRNTEKKGSEEPKAEIANIKSILGNYMLPNQDSITDVNSLVFYKEQRWDTSFVLTLRRDAGGIIGVYHEINPYNMEAGYFTDVGFFEGFTFTTDSATWEKIIKESKTLLDSINHEPNTGCLDCGRYILSHNGKFTIDGKDRSPFKTYEAYLRKTLIYPIYQKRKAVKEGAVPKE